MQISRETSAVSRAGFNTPLFIATHSNFKERVRVYSSIEAVAEDFNAGSVVYTAASRMFGQELRPSQIMIGRRQIDQFTASITNVTASTQYSVTINGIPYTYTSDETPTAAEIAAGLKASYEISPLTGVTFTDNLDGTFIVASTGDWSFKTGQNISATASPSTESWVDTLAAVEAENSGWFGLTTETHFETDVLALAAAIEARKKVYGVSTQDADAPTTSTLDIGSQLKALGYDKTFVIFSEKADTEYPECALMAYQLQEQPGSNTWAYKDLTGVTVSKLSSTASTNLANKNIITFEEIGGVRATTEGKMAGGEYVDLKQVA